MSKQIKSMISVQNEMVIEKKSQCTIQSGESLVVINL
jgi:hypothetical protein